MEGEGKTEAFRAIPGLERRQPEILAPAGSMESLKAAIAAGCDAVYMGGSRFGARAYADNPKQDEMIEAIRYCHRYARKIYMTVNTLLKQEELEQELYGFLEPYYWEGLDAVIVQDVGTLHFIHRHFPGLPIHASTQMSLTMGSSTAFLENYGVKRIVPARELTLAELMKMRKDTSLELEVFVHGAFCYSYSGQCLFSSMLGDRSGNRGRCAQPCRQKYQACSQKGAEYAYWLSPKEHCALSHIGELIETGIDSFKIEGRMKRPEYVAYVTSIYRKYTDLYIKMGQMGYQEYIQRNQREWEEDLRCLAELYNREGFSSGYLEGASGVPEKEDGGESQTIPLQKGKMLSKNRPNHGGVLVGKVVRTDHRSCTYHLKQEIHAQDVVEFRDERQRTIYEYTVGKDQKQGEDVTTLYQKGCVIKKGDLVYRTRDALLLKNIRDQYLAQEVKIPISMSFRAKEGERMALQVSTCVREKKKELFVEGEICQRAKGQPAKPEEIERLLSQTGTTCFEVEACEVILGESVFLPVGVVKRLRRQGLQKLQEELEMSRRTGRQDGPYRDGIQAMPMREKQKDKCSIAVSVLYAWQAELAMESGKVDAVYLRMDQMSWQELICLIDQGAAKGKKMYLLMPAVFRNAVYQRFLSWEQGTKEASGKESMWHRPGLAGVVIRNIESYQFLVKEIGMEPERIITDAGLYVMNQEAVSFWREQGIQRFTLPYELTGQELRALTDIKGAEMILYGRIPLMISAQCLQRNWSGCIRQKKDLGNLLWLKDAKGRKFPVFNACQYCYNIIYQDVPLSLGKEKTELIKFGIRWFRIDLTFENEQEVCEILEGRLPSGQQGHYYKKIL